jgi:hypothetical protein
MSESKTEIPNRPNERHPEVIRQVVERLRPVLADFLEEEDPDLDDLADTLKSNWDWNGYNLAKHLDNYCGWGADADLVEILSSAEGYGSIIVGQLTEEWVQKYGIRPAYSVGDRVACDISLRPKTGVIVKVYANLAKYVIQEDGKTYAQKESGWLIPYENVRPVDTALPAAPSPTPQP